MMKKNTVLIGLLGVGLAACNGSSSSEKKVTISVDLTYPSQGRGVQNTSSVRVWVLSPLNEEVTCQELVAAETEPFAVRDFERLADVVFTGGEAQAPFSVEAVEREGRAFVYGEVVDFVGATILAGCQELESLEDATLTLSRPGTFDCSHPDTPDGAPCDDGLLCTEGEECSGGDCEGGSAVDCSFVEDQCNGSTCSEELGCQPVPSPAGTNCEDGSSCTKGDQCDGEGSCEAGPVDCTDEDAGMCVVGTCDTVLQMCEAVDSDDTATTDDDACTNNANIELEDCYELDPADECDDTTGTCNLVAKSVPPDPCNNQCVTGGTCSGIICTVGLDGTPVETPEEDPETTCNDSRDNDCDGSIDCDDLDCADSPDCAS